MSHLFKLARILIATLAFVPSLLSLQRGHERPAFKITDLSVDELYFPKEGFLWGFAIAEQQNSPAECTESNWGHWERTNWQDGTPHIEDGQRAGTGCDHWNLYKEDIRLMKTDFNANAFRFSLAWDRIEPQEGVFDEAVLKHYCDEVDALLKAGIIPMITLHHFAHPLWLEEKGGFEKEENIAFFVRYAQKVFERLGSKVRFWCTFNEPNVFVMQGYLPLHPAFPPGTGSMWHWSASWQRGLTVLINLMKAHTITYQTLKGMKHGSKAQIGLVHQYLTFDCAGWNPADKLPGYWLNEFMAIPLTFLKTGKVSFSMRLTCEGEYQAVGPLTDFVGLNYYSRPVIRNFGGSCHDDQVMTDMPYPMDPVGMYDAIKDCAQVGVDVYITENGCPDKNNENDVNRQQWVKEYLKVVSVAIEDGYPVKGFFWWTLVDNFEWDMGYSQHFGVYSCDLESAQKTRTLKTGGRAYADIIKKARAGALLRHTADYHTGEVPRVAATIN